VTKILLTPEDRSGDFDPIILIMYDRTRIKICGLCSEQDVEAAIHAGVDAVGFVFVKSSPRYVSPDRAADLVCMLPPFIDAIGLFVDQSPSEVASIAGDAFIEIIQLQGHESNANVEELHTDFAIVRAVPFGSALFQQWKGSPLIDLLLVDGSSGGQGVTFCWEALMQETPTIKAPLIIAGGLTPQNVGEAISTVHPFAVDISSGVESEPGKKDAELMKNFCRAVREADCERGRLG